MLLDKDDISFLNESKKDQFENAKDEAVRILYDAVVPPSFSKATDAFLGEPSESTAESHQWVFDTLERLPSDRFAAQFFHGDHETIQKFLKKIYNAPRDGDQSKTISEVFNWINNTLLYGAFSECDQLLRLVEVDRLPYAVILAFLTFTFAAREQLEVRDALYQRVWDRIARDQGRQAAEQLLKTLK